MSHIPFHLIALALGFWVLTLADNNPNPLRLVGRIVGWTILIVAAGGLICSATFGMCRMKMCPKPGMAAGCPMSMGAGSHKMDCAHGNMPDMPAEAPQK